MNKPPIEKATLRQDKSLSKTTKPQHNIEKARAHLFGVCLLDSSYIHYLPVSIHFSEYGAFTLSMIQQGMGLKPIISHLEAVGISNAHHMLVSALKSIPDDTNLSRIFFNALEILSCNGVKA